MKVVSSDCIILKRRDFRERDRLVTFLARDKGRMTGIARGAQSITGRGVGSYEPGNRGRIFYVEKARSDLVAIRKCDTSPPYLFLTADYQKILLGGYMVELVDSCTLQAAEAEPFFLLLAGGLEALCGENSPRDLPLLRLGFELDFLACQGLQPEWSRCMACERPLFDFHRTPPRVATSGPHQFDVRAGGVRCPDCHAAGPGLVELSPGTMAFFGAWRGSAGASGVQPTRNALRELEAAVTRHLVHHLEFEPRSLALLPPLEKMLQQA